MLRMTKDNPAVHEKYSCHPSSVILYWISGLIGAWLKKAINVRETPNINKNNTMKYKAVKVSPIRQLQNQWQGI